MAEKDYQWLPQNSTNDYVSVYPVGSAIILDTASRVIYFQLALAVTHLVSVIDIDKSCGCTTLILEPYYTYRTSILSYPNSSRIPQLKNLNQFI